MKVTVFGNELYFVGEYQFLKDRSFEVIFGKLARSHKIITSGK